MSEPFLAEIKIVGFNFAPAGWAQCDGQILPINQNQSLFSLVGTTFGGDGRTSFGLPALRGRTPVHPGSGANWGTKTGEENHTLAAAEMPPHGHSLMASKGGADASRPKSALPAHGDVLTYTTGGGTPMSAQAVSTHPGSASAHNNMQPFLVLNFVIALVGVFPSRN